MQTRRDFLRSAAVLTGTAFVWGSVPEAIAKALAIDPERGSTFLDAEHIVVLMQENRSFDHCYGALRGVRGFRDPRAHVQSDGNPVWFQTDAKGGTYAPFRLDMKGTNATWIGGLPHSWPDQVDARNGGRYDRWLVAKPKRDLPFTLGHYTRQDIPFYYTLADAFTVCDQAFCSSLTGTTPNRLFLWTGTIRRDADDPARVQNAYTDYDRDAAWTTFPERLESAGVSWRIYQNEISLDTGFEGEQDPWLSSFTDNPIEWFTQYHVRFAASRRAFVAARTAALPEEIAKIEKVLQTADLTTDAGKALAKDLSEKKAQLREFETERAAYHEGAWDALPPHAKALHEKAFATNEGDPHHRVLSTLEYQDGDQARKVQVPKGDTLHRFRQDVETGHLPAVSWIVAPENFSDHPGAAWYGAWYVSEVLDILTKDPEVWKKTIFVLCYDENDGYFDHVPPFTAPHPDRPETGKASAGLDTRVDWSNAHGRDHAIGLGYRVPLVVCSPWSRGGCVNSEVFDHTSVIRLMEVWLAHRGKPVRETNISEWRRTVCGDLTSVFRPYRGEKTTLPPFLGRDDTVEGIHAAKFKARPKGGKALSKGDIASTRVDESQEPGARPSCPLPYDLHANAVRNGEKLHLELGSRKGAGAPFNAYAYGPEMVCRAYAVRAGDSISDEFALDDEYQVRVDGPNGFMREFRGTKAAPGVAIAVDSAKERVQAKLSNGSAEPQTFEIVDEAYGARPARRRIASGGHATVEIDPRGSHGWYDFTVKVGELAYRYAGRVETGRWSVTDPAMGGEITKA